jgi:hypothetical protein
MPYITVLDNRVGGSARGGDATLLVDRYDTLSDLMTRILDAARTLPGPRSSDGRLDRLVIFAHGIQYRDRPGYYGAALCAEDLTIRTVHTFHLISGRFLQIDMQVCGFAYMTPGCDNQEGDGNILCQMLADTTNSLVRASTCFQVYSFDRIPVAGVPAERWPRQNVDPGQWEGTVLTYAPHRGVIGPPDVHPVRAPRGPNEFSN